MTNEVTLSFEDVKTLQEAYGTVSFEDVPGGALEDCCCCCCTAVSTSAPNCAE